MLLFHNAVSDGGIRKNNKAEAASTASGPVLHDDNLHHFAVSLKMVAELLFCGLP